MHPRSFLYYVASRNSDEKLKELLSKVNDGDEELGLLTCSTYNNYAVVLLVACCMQHG